MSDATKSTTEATTPATGSGNGHGHAGASTGPTILVSPALKIPGREKLVKHMTRASKKRVIAYGEDFLHEKLPVDTRVIYSPPPLRAVPDVRAAVRHALNHPFGCDPLFAMLTPGMKVTIAVDDISLPLPPMRAPDVRGVVLEVVLELLADYGVDDIEIVMALAIHRRMTGEEIRHAVGEKVFRAYYPKRLYNHDAEDKNGMTHLGDTPHGEKVIINKRAVESDLTIYVNLNLVPMDGGHKSVAVGLTGYESLRSHHNPATILDCWSYMDPKKSAMHRSTARMGKVVNEHMNVFHIETTVNNDMFGPALGFLHKDEDEWSTLEEWGFAALKGTLSRLPWSAKRAIFQQHRAPYGVTGVFAGRTDATHERTLDACYRQYSVPVEGQTDVMIAGVPFVCPYNVNSIMNPLLVHCTALGYLFNFYRGRPLVREGGVLIICHPLYDEWHPDHHPSYIEFFHRCLSETRDSKRLEREHEQKFAADPTYVHMYRHGNAYHGAHPFYMWYWGENGRKHMGKVIIVGPESLHAAKVLGWETAKDLRQALEMAETYVGRKPSITHLHTPPILIADVT